MSEEELKVNYDDFDTILIDQDETTDLYQIVPHSLIRDKTISPACRWLIIYLISNKKEWNIKTRQICEHTKGFMGRDAIRKAINEAIKAGYMRRDIILRDSPKGRGKIRGYKYVIASSPKFKEVLRETEIQGPDDQAPDNQGTKVLLSKEITSIRNITPSIPLLEESAVASEDDVSSSKPKRSRAPSVFSPKVKEIADKMINILHKENPVYRVPENLEKFLENVQLMIEKDKQDTNNLLRAFEWACKDNEERNGFKGWQSIICTNKRKGKVSNPAEIFRGHFSTIYAQMKSKPKSSKFGVVSDDFEGSERQKRFNEGVL